MLQSLNHLHGFSLHAMDGEIGAVKDVLWDDAHWTVRYLVIDTGKWLPGRRVLISPAAVRSIDWPGRKIAVGLTCEQIKNSPDAASDEPVSRQHEEELSAYYGWPSYWTLDPFGYEPMSLPTVLPVNPVPGRPGDPHLRSAHELKSYHVAALDGDVGHVSDFAFEDATWRIAFLVIDTGSWLHKRLVLFKPEWIARISWEECRVAVNLSRESIAALEPFESTFPLTC